MIIKSFAPDDRFDWLEWCGGATISREEIVGFGTTVDGEVMPMVFLGAGAELSVVKPEQCDEWAIVRRGASPPDWFMATIAEESAENDCYVNAECRIHVFVGEPVEADGEECTCALSMEDGTAKLRDSKSKRKR